MAFKSLLNVLNAVGSTEIATVQNAVNATITRPIGQGVALYPADNAEIYIREGYRKNVMVYSIVAKCAKKFSQVPWYHYKIKPKERNTWLEYKALTTDGLSQKSLVEARKMRTKAIDSVVVDSPLSKKLAKPNRYQSRAQYLEQLYGFKLLTGEGNTWLSRGLDESGQQSTKNPPLELLLIPKPNLVLIKGGDAWDVRSYELVYGRDRIPTPTENMIMWKFPNYTFDPVTLQHMRGMAPLESGILLLQGSNEGAERIINVNKNQGAAGIAFNESLSENMTPEQSLFIRRQFDTVVNNKEVAGKIAVLSGKWNYVQFGMDMRQLKILEQMDATTEWFCNIFDFPPGLLTKNQTYENSREQKRDFIYFNIATAAYSLRDEWNAKLLPAFGLDQERDVIDCDILSLSELVADLGEQVSALKDAWWLTPNQKLTACGYDESTDPNMNNVFIPSGFSPIEDAAMPTGSNLNVEQDLLGG